jgi:hypothetical protein
MRQSRGQQVTHPAIRPYLLLACRRHSLPSNLGLHKSLLNQLGNDSTYLFIPKLQGLPNHQTTQYISSMPRPVNSTNPTGHVWTDARMLKLCMLALRHSKCQASLLADLWAQAYRKPTRDKFEPKCSPSC